MCPILILRFERNLTRNSMRKDDHFTLEEETFCVCDFLMPSLQEFMQTLILNVLWI